MHRPGFRRDLARFDNSWYDRGHGFIVRVLWYVINALVFRSYLFPFFAIKVLLLRLFGASVGRGVVVKPYINIKYPWLLRIGDHCWIGEDAWIDNLVEVRIGSNVCISQGAYLVTGNHNYKKETFDLVTGNITIEDGCWIGAKAIVCPGVKCGSHAVLTAGSVATRDLEPFGIYQGNPATTAKKKFFEDREPSDKKTG